MIGRADLIGDYTRAASRLAYLRQQEKTADPDQKMAVARAANVAAAEKRRLRDQLWRGVKVRERPLTISERAAEIASDAGREAWLDFYHDRAPEGTTEAELTARYGEMSDLAWCCARRRGRR